MHITQLIILAAVAALDLGLGVAVLAQNRRSGIHRLFALTALGMSVWLVANFMCDQPAFVAHALLLNRLTVAAGTLMGIPLLAFGLSFPDRSIRGYAEWWFTLGSLLLLAGAAAFTDTLVADVELMSWGTNVVMGWLYPYMAVWGLVICTSVTYVLVRRYRASRGAARLQFKYLYLGLGSFMIATTLMATIIPIATGSNEGAHFLPLATLLFLVPTGYAVVRHRLLDVRFVVLRGVAYTLLLVLSGGLWVLALEWARTVAAARFHADPFLLAVLSGLALTLGFQPMRRALERATDGYFYGRTYDPDRLLARLGSAMASTLDRRELGSLLADELRRELHLLQATVVFYADGRQVRVDAGIALSDADLDRILAVHTDGGPVVADDLEPGSATRTALRGCGVEVLMPLVGDEVLGMVVLGAKASSRAYSVHDMRFLEVLTSEAVIAFKNARLFEERNSRVRELTALNELAFALGSDIELDVMLDGALEKVVNVTGGDSGSILLFDADGTLTIKAALGLDADVVERTRITPGEGIAGWVAKTREELILVGDCDPRFSGELLRDEIRSAMSVPVIHKDMVIGVLNVNRRESDEWFTRENLDVLTSFAGQLGTAIENARLYADLESTFLGTISALASAVDAKDAYTFGHSNEVTAYAVAIAEKLDLGRDGVELIRIGATLHDIGKIGIDQAILHKPGRLSDEEREHINRHPTIGANILAPLGFLEEIVPLVLSHHERYDGTGYPSGIAGEEIAFGARIIAVADSFNAMTSDRPYRKALPLDVAIRELHVNAGTQFDPLVVEAFLEVLAERGPAPHDPARAYGVPQRPSPSTRRQAS